MHYGIIFLPSIHKFEKISPSPRKSNDGVYDIYECVHCGIRGKKFLDDSTYIALTISTKPDTITFCNKKWLLDDLLGQEIKITNINTIGSAIGNCKPGSIHKIVDAPFGQSNNDRGVHILGMYGNPIKVFYDEFIFCALIPKFERKSKTVFKRNK